MQFGIFTVGDLTMDPTTAPALRTIRASSAT